MQRKSPKLLEDIRDAAAFILESASDKTLADYRSDRLFRQAIERNFEIIGEAMKRLVRLDPDVAAGIDQHEQIIAFRNLLIHGYDLIDDEQVWKVITEHVPALRRQVQALLSQTDSAG
jgi:uncharacterized protein with HEPN domain